MPSASIAELTLPDPDGSEIPVRFVLGIDPDRRLTIGLRVGDEHTIDVSRHPGLLGRVADDRAEAIGETCRRACAEHGAWVAPVEASVVAVAGGASFPLLGAAYEREAAALAFVPRWSAPVLAALSPGPAARQAFGPRSTRATARALPVSLALAPERIPRLAGLGLAIGGAEVLEPDEIVAVLEAGADNAAVLSTDDIRALRRAARNWGRRVVAPLLREVAGATESTGRLLLALAMWNSVGRRFDRRVPHRLDDLVAEIRNAMPVDPGPPADRDPARPPASGTPSGPAPAVRPRTRRPATNTFPAAPPRPTSSDPVPAPRPPVPARHVPRRAPTAVPQPPTSVALPIDARLAPLDGLRLDRSLRLVLPRSTRELSAWGTRLGNCLGDYRADARDGRSLIVGVEVFDRLEYCIELTAGLTIRQFLGRRNRPPHPDDEAVVLAALSAARFGASRPLR